LARTLGTKLEKALVQLPVGDEFPVGQEDRPVPDNCEKAGGVLGSGVAAPGQGQVSEPGIARDGLSIVG
jgi:hypothetical protein